MKKIFTLLLIVTGLMVSGLSFGQAGSIDIGIRGSDCDQLIVEWNSSYSFVGLGQNAWTQSTMTIAWPQALGTNTLGTITSLLPGFTGWQYNGDAVLVGAEYRREVVLVNGSYNQDIPIGVTEVILITLNGSGTGDFNLSFFNPSGAQNTNISSGNHGTGMWSGTFNPQTAIGVSLDDKIVWNGTKWCGGSGTSYQPGPGDTKPCFITGLNGQLTVWNANVGSLTIQVGGELTILPGASLTNSGVTTINQPQGLIIGANALGSGSFIDNGTIVYTGSGSSKVQTYIANFASPGNLHIHQIGPTVKNPTFGSTYSGQTGVFLGEFDLMATGTYAYRYNEPGNNWVNIYQPTEPVPTACGLIFSDISGSPSILDMVGELASDGASGFIATPSGTSSLSQWAMTYTSAGGQGNYLASNPYVSGFDLAQFWTTYGSSYFGSVIRIWDGVANNWATMTRVVVPVPGFNYTNALVGTNGIINPGQGYFIEAVSNYFSIIGDQLYLTNLYRKHYYGPFIKESKYVFPNTLRLNVQGYLSSDELIIYFGEGLLPGTDYYDAEKWASMNEEAVEISTINSDLLELTVNALPPLTQMISIPLNFKAGTNGDFVFSFSDLESFEIGTEIYLEDLLTGGNWINLLTNPVYEFSGLTTDLRDRFILHFFGPTSIDDPVADRNAIQIYSWGHDAYIVNRGTETVKEYIAYDMMGRVLHRGTLPNSTVNKVFIGNVNAYYIVKVITNEGRIYTEKVYINK